ncbi:MAG: sugar phosphate isomerase/epimerase [Firmicutes bacterium]|nr:sugar phosphate isomerase/epimerase [Bacillota bacterium]
MECILLCDASQPESAADLCRRYGLGVELQAFANPDYEQSVPDAVLRHNEVYKDISPRALHGPFADLSMGSSDRLIRQVTYERFVYAHDRAVQVGAEHIVLHHGYVPGTNTPGGWLRRSVELWEQFFDEVEVQAQIYLENLLEDDPQLLLDVVSTVGRDSLGICLDIGHAHCHSRLPVLEWIMRAGDLIGYVHLHDNHGRNDDHLGLGSGSLPLDEVCSALEQYCPDAIWALEVGPDNAADSVFWLDNRGYLRAMRKSWR